MPDTKANTHLLPDLVKRPVMLLWAMIVPQVILLLIHLRAFWLVSAEIPAEDLPRAYTIFAGQAALLAAAFLLWGTARARGKDVAWGWNILLLAGHIGYLWYISVHLWQVIPSQIEPWMLDRETVMLQQFTLMMPGLFYAALRLACFETRLRMKPDFGWSLLATVSAPAAFYLIIFALGRGRCGMPRLEIIPGFVMAALFIGLTVITFIGLIRILVMSYNLTRSRGRWAQGLFLGAVCLAGPLGGLWLNRNIPFPADFQSPWVYGLAVLNGLIVMWPAGKKTVFPLARLFARALAYPFTFYFFLVFLPFLPVSLFAMFAVGAGFLILVPVLLGLVHTRALADDFQHVRVSRGLAVSLAVLLAGLVILPGYFTLEAMRDKTALAQALRYVYSPDYTRDAVFSGSVPSVRRTLVQLKRYKDGRQWPYLSEFYNAVVFEDMVLSDNHLAQMYRLFTGEDFPKEKLGPGRWGGMTSLTGRGRRGWGGPGRQAVDRRVDLVSTQVTRQDKDGVMTARVRLEMRNTGDSGAAEFFREVQMPEGILVSGFALKIGQDMVPGQIFERRTALWVYQMIRDAWRDPSLLVYKTPTEIDLSVFPFEKDETRVVEIDFQFPSLFHPEISIGGQALDLNPAEGVPQIVRMPSAQGPTFVLPHSVVSALPSIRRQPYLHFILDQSQGRPAPSGYWGDIRAVLQQFPDIHQARITAANFNSQTVTPQWIDVRDEAVLRQTLENIILPRQGGLDAGRVIRQEMARFVREAQGGAYPVFVLVSPKTGLWPQSEEMADFISLIPDVNYGLTVRQGQVEKHAWMEGAEPRDQDVIMLKAGTQTAVISADGAEIHTAHFYSGDAGGPLEVFQPAPRGFVPVDNITALPADIPYSRGMEVFAQDLRARTNPSEFDQALPALVQASRDTGVMIPSTSYIVVERSSHGKTLQLKERQRLAASQGLEFEESFQTPAPSLGLMLAGIFGLYLLRNRKRFFNAGRRLI